jgi:hypothetical protein
MGQLLKNLKFGKIKAVINQFQTNKIDKNDQLMKKISIITKILNKEKIMLKIFFDKLF